MVLENESSFFTWEEYKKRCLEYYKVNEFKIILFKVLGPLTSLIEKGIIRKRETDYAIDYRLRPYLTLAKKVTYGLAVRIGKNYELKI